MKKTFIIISLVLMTCLFADGKTVTDDNLKKKIEIIETETRTYGGENISLGERVKKAEIYVFGTSKNGNLEKRIEDLSEVLGVTLAGKEFQNKIAGNDIKNTTKPENKQKNEKTAEKEEKTKDFAYYSPKTQNQDFFYLEKKLLGKNYDNDSMENRLSRVEMKLFSRNFNYEDNSTRIERLKSVQKAAKNSGEYKVNKFAKYAVAGAQIGGLVLLILAMIL